MECVMNTEIVIGGERFEEAMPQKRPMLMLDSLDSYEYDESGPELTGAARRLTLTARSPPGLSSRSWRRR